MYRRIDMSRVRGLESTIKNLQETLTDLLLIGNIDQSVAVSVYSMSYEEYCSLSYKL